MRGALFRPRLCFRAFSDCNSAIRVRFAPSPTGHLHLGGLRTALFNYLFARASGGKLILRIEDTDQSRFVTDADTRLEEMLQWMGIHLDESPLIGGDFGPYRQSERLPLYESSVKQLLEQGAAYRCFCTEKRLDLLRKEAARNRSPSRYDGRCRDLSHQEVEDRLGLGETFTVRLKLRPGIEHFNDLVYGVTRHDVFSLEGDPIIMKSDGFPTYHLANVVDDHHMKISHVLRGVEWQVSTPKHLMLYEAFGWSPPHFAHLPLIMNNDGTKLSKRQGDIHVEHFKKAGLYPEAILNFVSLIGGGFEDKEHRVDRLYSAEDLADKFCLHRINTNSCKMELELLRKLNRMALKQKLLDEKNWPLLISELREVLKREGWEDASTFSDDYLKNALLWSQDRICAITDLASQDMKFLWSLPKKLDLPDLIGIEVLNDIVTILQESPDEIRSKDVVQVIRHYCSENNIKFSHLMKFLRIVFAGSTEGPPVGEMIEFYGKQNALYRLGNGIKLIN